MFIMYFFYEMCFIFCTFAICCFGTHEDEKTVLYKARSLDGTKPNTSPKTKTETNPNPNTNPNPKLTQILTLFSCFMVFSSTVP